MPFIRQLIAFGVGAEAEDPFLVATTTAPGQTVTINRLTPTGGSLTIHWGDGDTTVVANGVTAAQAHVYAATGVYNITVDNLALVTQIDLRDAKLGSFNTSTLASNVMVYFYATAITGSTINSSDMTAWILASFYLYSMPVGGTYTINSSHMSAWTPSSFYVVSMAAGTYSINSSHMSSWKPASFYLQNMPSGTYTFGNTDFDGWTTCVGFYLYTLVPVVSQATVNAILYSHHKAATSRTAVGGTIHVAGTNQAPSGVYQACASCPVTGATPGKEIAHELINDGCGAIANHWTAVTITA